MKNAKIFSQMFQNTTFSTVLKKVYGFPLIVLTIFTGLLLGCESRSITDVSPIEVSQNVKNKVDYFVGNTNSFIFNDSNDIRHQEFKELNEKELDYYFLQMSKKMAVGREGENGMSVKDFEDYFYKMQKGMNGISQKIYFKSSNQIEFDQYLNLVDNFTNDILNDKNYGISSKIVEALNQDSNKSSSAKTAAVACLKYYYGIPTGVSLSGSITCNGYTNATNLRDNDCDYEFIFPYNLTVSKKLNLKSANVSVLAILTVIPGAVNGRLTTDKKVAFLIGKGRITWTGISPSTVVRTLYGNW